MKNKYNCLRIMNVSLLLFVIFFLLLMLNEWHELTDCTVKFADLA